VPGASQSRIAASWKICTVFNRRIADRWFFLVAEFGSSSYLIDVQLNVDIFNLSEYNVKLFHRRRNIFEAHKPFLSQEITNPIFGHCGHVRNKGRLNMGNAVIRNNLIERGIAFIRCNFARPKAHHFLS